jgi:formylglycine-generating enzyme required for sulfatase activity
VIGLFSGVAEWTSTWYQPYPGAGGEKPSTWSNARYRVVRGAPRHVLVAEVPAQPLTPRDRWALPRHTHHPKIGLRCARSERAHLKAEDFEIVLGP